ncbi:MAG: hypothetical protein GY711_17030 [bacterium]|nr:hypothetical protein [bacterium]
MQESLLLGGLCAAAEPGEAILYPATNFMGWCMMAGGSWLVGVAVRNDIHESR